MQTDLVERERELTLISSRLDRAASGHGGCLVVLGPPGVGKSALLRAISESADDLGFTTLSTAADQLGRTAPFSVVLRLFSQALEDLTLTERETLTKGPARLAIRHLSGETAEPFEQADLVSSLEWLARGLAANKPVLLLVDDLQWADEESLLFLGSLRHQITDLPLMVLAAVREIRPQERRPGLAVLIAAAETEVIHPGPLSRKGTERLLLHALGDLDRDAIDTAFAVTGGNPFLVEALARLLQVEDQVTADLVREAVPESVINSVVAWIAELGEAEQGLLQAVATLGHTTTSLAAGLVGIDLVTAGAAADRLRSIGILKDEAGLGFRHDLLRSATLTTFGVDAREHLHRAAATMLADADIEAAAAQLLQTTGSGDQTAVRILVAAAERALDAGAPRSAVTLLRRAVSEPPTVAETPSLVLQLGLAEMRTFDPTCVETLTRANRELTNPADRTRCALALAEALNFAGFHDRAAEVLEGALCAVDDPELSLELEARLISTHLLLPQRIEHARELLAARPGLRGRTPAERLFLNQQLCNAAGTNQPAADIRELVRLAIHADDTPERTDWVWARLFLVNVGEHDEVRRLADYGMDQALRVGSVSGMVTVSYLRGVNEIGAGCFQQAEFNFREMLDLGERISPGPLVPLLGRCGLAKTLALQGQVEQALQLLAEFPEEPPQNWPFNGVASLYAARAIAFHAASRPAEALENAQRLGRLLKRLDVDSPTWACWRALAIPPLRALGRLSAARSLAEENVQQCERSQVPALVGEAYRLLGELREEPVEQLDLLRRAVEVLEDSQNRYCAGMAQLSLGSAMRRTGQRSRAREILLQAKRSLDSCGAQSAIRMTEEELAATGARRSRRQLVGLEALTPSERRVVDLAAAGQTNPEISRHLQVTPKTVETHLTSAYRKLGIGGRSELAGTLAGDDPVGPS